MRKYALGCTLVVSFFTAGISGRRSPEEAGLADIDLRIYEESTGQSFQLCCQSDSMAG